VIADLMQQLNGRGAASGALSYEDHAAGLMGLTSGLAAQRRLERDSISVEQWAKLIRDYLARLPADGSPAAERPIDDGILRIPRLSLCTLTSPIGGSIRTR
jgi:hypothetical protein